MNRREDQNYDFFVISGKGNSNPEQVTAALPSAHSPASPQGKARDTDVSVRVSLHQTNSLTHGPNISSHQIVFHVFLVLKCSGSSF